MPLRRAGAPRLIEWTGERCVPWAPNVQVVYEHYHRYLWARSFVAGRRVLDLGSGEGFGAALLADVADAVVGVDIDERTIEHSRLNYSAPNLDFRGASATDLGDFPDDAFQAVVAFEVIEHVIEQEALLGEVARVLSPGGLLLLSTPDRRAYSEATGHLNPFHKRELTQDELTALLQARFASLALFGQRTITGSQIDALDRSTNGSHLAVRIERAGDDWRETGPPAPTYLIAVASNVALPEVAAGSTLSDFGLEILRAADRTAAEAESAAEESERRRADAAAELEAARLDNAHAASDRERLVAEIVDRTRELASARGEVDRVRADAAGDRQALAQIDLSVTWQLIQRARAGLYGALGGRASPGGRTVSGALRLLGRRMGLPGHVAPARGEVRRPPLSLPRFPTPEISVVIPLYNGAALSQLCLQSIVHGISSVPYEVVLVDDAADVETKDLLEAVDGARIVVNDRNLGYLHSVNRGAAEARGRYLLLLNNDTELLPGAVEAMRERAGTADDVGIVAAKLVYPDGTLQEAGGIVWREGVAWNYGRGGDAAAPEHNYVREIDYGSAAALLIRAEVWRAAGGFDERFAPGYFEDTDLCFSARALGWRVLYEPRAVVTHVEGASHGTDLRLGGKRQQLLNQPVFAAKWKDVLREHPRDPTPQRAYLASDWRRGPHVLVIDHRVPTPDRDSGSLRMYHLLEGLLRLGCRVTFLPDNMQPVEPYTSRLQGVGVEVLAGAVDVQRWLAIRGPSLRLAVLSRPFVAARYMHLIREHAPGAKLAYDTVDLHHLREARRRVYDDRADGRIAHGVRELELALARSADVTLAVTEEERELLARVEPGLEVELVPNAHEMTRDVPPPSERDGLLFVGGFEHVPNVDAVMWLARAIMPLVWRDLPDVTLTVVGGDVPPEVRALASPGISIAGWVEDIGPILRASRVMVAPLRYGAGMKGKVTQSLAAGLPVVTSPIGAEGLNAEHGRELLTADGTQEFARHVVRLYEDDELWRTLSVHGQALVERVCSPSVQLRALERLLAASRSPEVVDGGLRHVSLGPLADPGS